MDDSNNTPALVAPCARPPHVSDNNALRQIVGRLGKLCVYTEADPDVFPGHQSIVIHALKHNSLAESLVDLLCDGTDTDFTWFSNEGIFIVPHTIDVDRRLREIVDLCSRIRYCAPGMRQLMLFPITTTTND
jgi:hypothetical protein